MTTSVDAAMHFRLDAWRGTHVGLKREQNEDANRCTPARGVFVIADGMGGHPGGEVASTLAVEACHTALLRGRGLVDSFAAAHEAVVAAQSRQPSLTTMGTTLVAATFGADGLNIAWTGDSRVYRYRAGILHLLTEDHGHDGGLQEYVGKPGGAVMGLDSRSMQAGDRILMCTDGLHGFVPEETIRARIRDGKSPRHIVDSLIGETLSEGGFDNVTIALIRITR